jgi:hypothetical protein
VDSQLAVSLHVVQALLCALLKQMGVSTKVMNPFNLDVLASASSSGDRFASGLELAPCSGSFQSLDAHRATVSFSAPALEVFIVRGSSKLVRRPSRITVIDCQRLWCCTRRLKAKSLRVHSCMISHLVRLEGSWSKVTSF